MKPGDSEYYPCLSDYSSKQAMFASPEFAALPLEDILACYAGEFDGDSIYHFNDGKNPRNDEEAKKMAIECLVAGKPRPWAKVPEDAVI
ncbi:hypothetical protein GFD17_08825 [Bifidobacterium sp. SMB2]|uniref:Uncharacterized protein n=1 Tax=Bifidobacterium saimiriisciurei TaxID=2661627 RepID=A0ABX0CJ78_9BIFI|nr:MULTISPECIES: hypothetical protein [Bifidobacterium]NEG96848.1 hypothetical protein [Bifidobacterium sp. SMB2]NEH12317.1 hypothetical protein [Bifidobacterium saimiriisciurei]